MRGDGSEPLTTSVHLIDRKDADRAHIAEGLKSCSPDYLILEGPDGESGLYSIGGLRRSGFPNMTDAAVLSHLNEWIDANGAVNWPRLCEEGTGVRIASQG